MPGHYGTTYDNFVNHTATTYCYDDNFHKGRYGQNLGARSELSQFGLPLHPTGGFSAEVQRLVVDKTPAEEQGRDDLIHLVYPTRNDLLAGLPLHGRRKRVEHLGNNGIPGLYTVEGHLRPHFQTSSSWKSQSAPLGTQDEPQEPEVDLQQLETNLMHFNRERQQLEALLQRFPTNIGGVPLQKHKQRMEADRRILELDRFISSTRGALKAGRLQQIFRKTVATEQILGEYEAYASGAGRQKQDGDEDASNPRKKVSSVGSSGFRF